MPTEGEDNSGEAEANAQYTALAVNNFDKIADALAESLGYVLALSSHQTDTDKQNALFEFYNKGNALLARIS